MKSPHHDEIGYQNEPHAIYAMTFVEKKNRHCTEELLICT
jgi:hypothetical protein